MTTALKNTRQLMILLHFCTKKRKTVCNRIWMAKNCNVEE